MSQISPFADDPLKVIPARVSTSTHDAVKLLAAAHKRSVGEEYRAMAEDWVRRHTDPTPTDALAA